MGELNHPPDDYEVIKRKLQFVNDHSTLLITVYHVIRHDRELFRFVFETVHRVLDEMGLFDVSCNFVSCQIQMFSKTNYDGEVRIQNIIN